MRLPFTIFLILLSTLANAQNVDIRWYRSDAMVDSARKSGFWRGPSCYLHLIDTVSVLAIVKKYEKKDKPGWHSYIQNVGQVYRNEYIHSACLNLLSEMRKTWIDDALIYALAFQGRIADTTVLGYEFRFWESRIVQKRDNAWKNSMKLAFLLNEFGSSIPVSNFLRDTIPELESLIYRIGYMKRPTYMRGNHYEEKITLNGDYNAIEQIDIMNEPELKQFLFPHLVREATWKGHTWFTYKNERAVVDIWGSIGCQIDIDQCLLKFTPPSTIECQEIRGISR